MEGEKLILAAKKFARKCHAGQKRDDGSPYIRHPGCVASLVDRYISNLRPDDPIYTAIDAFRAEMIAAAWLHDVVEDCGVSIDMISAKFGGDVGVIVNMLTRREGENYYDFIMRVGENDESTIVKICDIKHNLSTIGKEGSLADKWRLALHILEVDLRSRSLKQEFEDRELKMFGATRLMISGM